MQDEWIAASHAGKAFRSVCLLDCRILSLQGDAVFHSGLVMCSALRCETLSRPGFLNRRAGITWPCELRSACVILHLSERANDERR